MKESKGMTEAVLSVAIGFLGAIVLAALRPREEEHSFQEIERRLRESDERLAAARRQCESESEARREGTSAQAV